MSKKRLREESQSIIEQYEKVDKLNLLKNGGIDSCPFDSSIVSNQLQLGYIEYSCLDNNDIKKKRKNNIELSVVDSTIVSNQPQLGDIEYGCLDINDIIIKKKRKNNIELSVVDSPIISNQPQINDTKSIHTIDVIKNKTNINIDPINFTTNSANMDHVLDSMVKNIESNTSNKSITSLEYIIKFDIQTGNNILFIRDFIIYIFQHMLIIQSKLPENHDFQFYNQNDITYHILKKILPENNFIENNQLKKKIILNSDNYNKLLSILESYGIPIILCMRHKCRACNAYFAYINRLDCIPSIQFNNQTTKLNTEKRSKILNTIANC